MKQEIEINKGELPAGFIAIAFREPKPAEFFINDGGTMEQADESSTSLPHLIIKKKRWLPKHGASFWFVDDELEPCESSYNENEDMNVIPFKTKEDAQKAADYSREYYEGFYN